MDSLVNDGTGSNYGVELTLERFLSDNYYFLVTGSLYNSKYKGSDGIERNTVFNTNYTVNALAGAEFNLDKNNKTVLTFNMKGTYSGGKRFKPINFEASQLAGTAIYDEEQVYSNRYDDYFRVDIKTGLKVNGKKMTQEWAVDLQNISNRKNIFQELYDPITNAMKTEYQLGFFPMVTYRVLF